jgi:hypothetical protein
MPTQAAHSDRIQMNVPVDGQSVADVIMQNGFESSLKEGPGPLKLFVEPNAVAHVQPLDRPAQVGSRSFHLQMIMVGHQDIAMHPQTKALR